MKVLLIVLLAGLAVESSADDSCRTVKALDSFEMKKFAGKYYQFKFFSKLIQSASSIYGDCNRQTYKFVDGKVDKLVIKNTQIDAKGNDVISKGTAEYKDPAKRNGVITVTMNQGTFNTTIVYNVLVFHQRKYIIVYSCIQGVSSGWVLTTEKVPSTQTKKKIDADILEAYKKYGGPSPNEYRETPQKDCRG